MHRLLGRPTVARRMGSGDGLTTGSTARCWPTRGSTAASPGGIPRAGRWSSAAATRASSSAGCRASPRSSPRTRSPPPSRSPSRRGRRRCRSRRARLPRPVAGCEWSRRLGDLLFELDGALSERARAAYGQALAAPPGCLARADEARLGAWLGAVDLGAGRADSALGLFERALGAGNRELSTFADRAAALEALGRRADAAAAWADVAVRAGDSPLAVRARARAARLRDVSRDGSLPLAPPGPPSLRAAKPRCARLLRGAQPVLKMNLASRPLERGEELDAAGSGAEVH